jgi:hypothetical protein
VLAVLCASFGHAVCAGPAFGAYALADLVAVGGEAKLAVAVWGVTVLWARLVPAVFAGKTGAASTIHHRPLPFPPH